MSDKKLKRREKRHSVIGVILVLIVGIIAGMYISNNENLSNLFDKNNYGIANFWDSFTDKIPELISQVRGSGSKEVSPDVANVLTENTETPPVQTPQSQNTTVKTPPVQNIATVKVTCPSSSLSSAEVEKIRKTILGSDFVSDLPKEGVISLTFFTFCNGERIIQNNFLIGKDQILTSGTPDIYLTLHYKYIAELNGDNLCEVIPRANANGDLGAYSDLSDSKLIMKYSGLMKYRDCFGL